MGLDFMFFKDNKDEPASIASINPDDLPRIGRDLGDKEVKRVK